MILNSIAIEVEYAEDYENINIEELELKEGEDIKRIINSKKEIKMREN